MDIDRQTVWQLVATVVVLGAFIAGLAVLSQSFVTDVAVEDEPAAGDLSGDVSFEGADGTGSFDGDLDGSI